MAVASIGHKTIQPTATKRVSPAAMPARIASGASVKRPKSRPITPPTAIAPASRVTADSGNRVPTSDHRSSVVHVVRRAISHAGTSGYRREILEREIAEPRPAPAEPTVRRRAIERPRVVRRSALTVGPASDPAEREADEVAEQVVARLRSATDEAQEAPPASTRIQRSAAAPCSDGGAVDADTASGIAAARRSGRSLPEAVRSSMERAFGDADLGNVRIHRSAAADHLNRSLGARAFTLGSDVFVRRDEGDLASDRGQRLLAHELTHVVQQTSASTRIQRKIGLEFEFEAWQTAEAPAAHYAAASAFPPDKTNWQRLPKGKALARGAGFELQADDDPSSAARSDLEVVTSAFDESPAGRGQLRTAVQRIVAALNAITANKNVFIPAGHLPRATDLGLNVVTPRSFLEPAFANMLKWEFKAKPQTTIGFRLDAIAKVLEDLFAAPGETGADAAARQAGRQQVGGWNPGGPAGLIATTQGQAPSQARQSIAAYTFANGGAPASTPELVGLLSLVIAYLRMADQGLVRSYPKTIAPIMARTDFGAMFKMLSPAERAWYGSHKGQPFFDLVQSAPWLAGMAANDEVFSQGVANARQGSARHRD